MAALTICILVHYFYDLSPYTIFSHWDRYQGWQISSKDPIPGSGLSCHEIINYQKPLAPQPIHTE